jgi:hypothetical protein
VTKVVRFQVYSTDFETGHRATAYSVPAGDAQHGRTGCYKARTENNSVVNERVA